MASTSSTPNWLEMPHELMLTIFHKLGAVEILENAQLVCTNWRRVSKDPALWKVIDMNKSIDSLYMDEVYVDLTKQAVNRSSGELIAIIMKWFCTDDLLHYISQSSSKLQCLCLSNCFHITGCGLSDTVKRLAQLEHLYVYHTYIEGQDIEVIGLNCPHLKSFRLNREFHGNKIESLDVDACAIAKSMPELRHLQLLGNTMTDEGLQFILDGCPLLESLDVRKCFNLNIAGDLVQRCKKQIKDFKCSTEDDFLEYRLQEEYENYSDGSYENYADYYSD
ncbi:putative F-box/LRR-repeat protein 23 [Rutidosis leptorrhynchoides]|uniref:putative F-box/LRR-repeat protein 23 n=1 Tax=Rutidosis leptorrhynchoides TaxID=125765 RepID=UPI003A98E60F